MENIHGDRLRGLCLPTACHSKRYQGKDKSNNTTAPRMTLFSKKKSCHRWDSNPRHSALQPSALLTELLGQLRFKSTTQLHANTHTSAPCPMAVESSISFLENIILLFFSCSFSREERKSFSLLGSSTSSTASLWLSSWKS